MSDETITVVGLLLRKDGRLAVHDWGPHGWAPPAAHRHEWLGAADDVAETMAMAMGATTSGVQWAAATVQTTHCSCASVEDGETSHLWEVYRADAGEVGDPVASIPPIRWMARDEILAAARRTVSWAQGQISDQEWVADPGIAPVWIYLLTCTGWISRYDGVREHELDEIDRVRDRVLTL